MFSEWQVMIFTSKLTMRIINSQGLPTRITLQDTVGLLRTTFLQGAIALFRALPRQIANKMGHEGIVLKFQISHLFPPIHKQSSINDFIKTITG